MLGHSKLKSRDQLVKRGVTIMTEAIDSEQQEDTGLLRAQVIRLDVSYYSYGPLYLREHTEEI